MPRAGHRTASPGGARNEGPTMSSSDFQRGYEEHATEGERPWAGSAVPPEAWRGGLAPDPEPRRAPGRPPRRTSRRGMLIGVAALVVLIVIGAVVFLAGKTKPTAATNAGNVAGVSPPVTSSAASPSVSPSS